MLFYLAVKEDRAGKRFFKTADFDLAATLASGQVFRWQGPPFIGWIGSDLVTISQNDSELIFQGTSEAKVRDFFSLEVDLNKITRQIDVDPIVHAALQSHWGVRLIRQEPWECVASFILSAFNNIPRLTGMLNRLALRFGEPESRVVEATPWAASALGPSLYQFPGAERLAEVSERVLRSCGLGFRAPYIRKAAQKVASGEADLEGWRRLEDEPLRRALMTIPGVGEKVAECVMLFAYGRTAAFPVDVWIGRAMRRWYFRRKKVTDRRIRAFARRHFGVRCGWAQQVLYCHARSSGFIPGSVSKRRSRSGRSRSGSGRRWGSPGREPAP